MGHVTVSAKIDKKLRKKLKELSIKPSEVIRRALEEEVERKTREHVLKKIEKLAHCYKGLAKKSG